MHMDKNALHTYQAFNSLHYSYPIPFHPNLDFKIISIFKLTRPQDEDNHLHIDMMMKKRCLMFFWDAGLSSPGMSVVHTRDIVRDIVT